MASKSPDLKSILPKYEVNPSVKTLTINSRNKRVFIQNNQALIITDAKTGDQSIGNGGATFIRPETVDTEQFIKIYVSGVAKLAELTGAGHKLFGIVYKLMLERPNDDRIFLDFHDLSIRKIWPLARISFIRAVNDLLKNEILFQSYGGNMYFINVQYFFNGDRINIVKSYQLSQGDLLDGL